MGFIASANTVTITAKLTPFGRQQLLTNSSSIITHFTLGDSDANYYGSLPLDMGRIPSLAGEIGTNNLFSNGVYSGVGIKSPIIVNQNGDIRKPVEAGSSTVNIKPVSLGVTGATGTALTKFIIDRNSGNIDGNTNLFHTFGLPITQADRDLYTSYPEPTGYMNTAIRQLNQNKVIVLAIDKCSYGEILDGKTIHVSLPSTGSTTYNLYSTFQRSTTPTTSLDTQVRELLGLGNAIGNNVAFLFSDEIQRPNGNSSRSWSTGYNTIRPFSVNGKERFNPITVTSTNTVMDTAVGVAYLDRGIIVITNPTMVNNYDPITATGTTINYNSISNEVSQNITCVVERDEFNTSTNRTYNNGDMIRISELALYDTFNNVIAYAKSNEHILIGANQYMALGVRILV